VDTNAGGPGDAQGTPTGDAPKRTGLSLVPSDSVSVDTGQSPPAPRYGVRGPTQGPRGCWAVNKRGDPCSAAKRNDGDYCNAHSGVGIAEDPARYQHLARAASAENRRRRAVLRATLGISSSDSPRGLLKAAVFVERERVVAAALAGATDPTVPLAQRSRHALALLDATDPLATASVELPLPDTPEGVAGLGLRELEALAEQVHSRPIIEA
jgi:hypothetical protein